MINPFKLKSTIKYPTSIIINGLTNLGMEIADSLLAQGGYVIIIDAYNDANLMKLNEKFANNSLLSFLDYSAIPHLEEDIRRLDYVFYLSHAGGASVDEISTQSFLKYSNYLDTTLNLAVKFEAKFLVTTSIKAHQMLMSRMDLDVNFGVRSEVKHTVYTEMEVQRYAESLCLEYATKKSLNVRIVRIGEVIGEGMDFASDSQFTKLILAGVSGKDLELLNDGLDTEWFVHLLDAAYGVIKAQFSKDTEAEIFSLAYENSVTHLSLAYKIQELEPNAKEITFVEASDGLPPLRLHKPAPNLSKIGWKPRIDFEKATAESLSAAKLYLLQSETPEYNEGEKDNGVVGKLKSFLSIADQSPSPAEMEMLNSGPVSRLIAERRRQENARIQSMNKADETIKNRWKERNRTPWQRYKAWIWRNFLDARTNFGVLRQITPGQFAGYVLVGTLLIVLYFVVVSPVIVFSRNLVLIYGTFPALEASLRDTDFGSLYQNSKIIDTAISENLNVMKGFEGVANLMGAERYYSSLTQTMQNYAQTLEGISNLAYAVEPLSTYLNEYRDNTSFRLNTETYLSTTGGGTDYTPILSEINARRAFAEVGKSKISQALLSLDNQDLSMWPEFLTVAFKAYNSQLKRFEQVTNFQDIALHGNDLLGVDAPKTYLILVLDNSRPMPIGGELSSYMLLTLQNGTVGDVRIQAVDEFNPDMTKLPAYALAEMNLTSYQAKNASNVVIKDLAYISSPELFGEVAGGLWAQALNRDVDGVILVNYHTISHLLDKFGPIQVENQQFTSTNLLSQLSELQTSTPTAQRRNDLMAQLLALTVEKMLDDYKSSLPKLLSVLATSAESKNLIVSKVNSEYSQVAADYGIDGNAVARADLPIWIDFVADGKNVSPNRFPALNQAVKFTVNADSSLQVSLNVKFPAISNADQVGLCTILGIKDFSVQGVEQTRVKTARGNNKNCLIVDVVAETDITFVWTTLPFESLDNQEYNLELGVGKVGGIEMISDFEITLNPGLRLQRIRPDLTSIGNKVAFTQTLKSDQLIQLTIIKD